jgi:hypothetical protein
MGRTTIREAIRLLMVAFGVVCALIAVLVTLPLLLARSESGTVEFHSTLVRGEVTNLPIVVWGGGVALRLDPGDISPSPKAGDLVTVLVIGKGGTLKYGRSYWSTLTWAGGFAAVGFALIIGGLYVLRHHPTPHEIGITQAV